MARRLGVAPSTISRQVGRLYVNHAVDGDPLLDWAQVQLARQQHLNTAKRRTLAPAEPEAPARTVPGEPEPSPNTRGFWDTELAREKALDAKADRLLRFGALVERVAVEEAMFDLGRLQRESLDTFAENVAHQVAALTDPREVAAFLRQDLRKLQHRWADEAERLMKAMVPEGLDDVVPVEA